MDFYAHTREGAPPGEWEPLERHLDRVAQLAAMFGGEFGSADWGRLAGLWHDLGKYRPEFQRRLLGSREQVEHAGAGAALAMEKGPAALPLAFVIAGHHAGLANWQAQEDTSQLPLTTRVHDNAPVLNAIRGVVPAPIWGPQIPALPARVSQPSHAGVEDQRRRFELWTRLLFSALVDADRLATEEYGNPDRSTLRRGGFASITALRERLDDHLRKFAPNTDVNRLRARVLADCRAATSLSPGFFSLTAPTGAGKTLSSMAFALGHAEQHGLRRVIVVLPYTSIIEQNAMVYAGALGAEDVIEHHSNVDVDSRRQADSEQEVRRQLAAENWDAPVIVTTTVQFFESLLSNRPSRCRKLHNVTKSVVILDEAQALPSGYLACLLDVMGELARTYGCSIVISTATQPALGRRAELPTGLQGVREIIRDPGELAAALKRVDVRWPDRDAAPTTWDDLAARLRDHDRVLAIVHLRHDARRLARELPSEGRFHLSALMCPAHRSAVLTRIRGTLAGSGPCRVVATQLVEAGVDLDFPVVYRALAGLDSIAQAAGRCNREGKAHRGVVHVFRAETKPPIGVLRKGLESTEALLRAAPDGLDVSDPRIFDEFFRVLYGKCETDSYGVQVERERLNFATVSERVRLVEDGYTHAIVVPWGDWDARVRAFQVRPSRETQRSLQPHIVQVYGGELRVLRSLGALEPLTETLDALVPAYRGMYSEEFGLTVEESAHPDPAAYIVTD